MVPTQLLLIDGDNLLKRYYHALGDMVSSSGLRMGGLYGFVLGLKRALWAHRDHLAVVVWDGGHAHWRKALLPGYKDRKKTQEEKLEDDGVMPVKVMKRHAWMLLKDMAVHQAAIRGVEADDIIAYLSRASDESVIWSTDKDFYQLVRLGHSQTRCLKGEDQTIDIHNFRTTTGVRTPWYYRLMKALAGDSGDRVPGVPRIGEKTALEILQAVTAQLSDVELDPTGPDAGRSAISKVCSGPTAAKRWRKVNDCWRDFEVSLRCVDLWSDKLLSHDQVDQVVAMVESPAGRVEEFKVRQKFKNWEFPEDVYETLFHILNVRRRFVPNALDFSFAIEPRNDWGS